MKHRQVHEGWMTPEDSLIKKRRVIQGDRRMLEDIRQMLEDRLIQEDWRMRKRFFGYTVKRSV